MNSEGRVHQKKNQKMLPIIGARNACVLVQAFRHQKSQEEGTDLDLGTNNEGNVPLPKIVLFPIYFVEVVYIPFPISDETVPPNSLGVTNVKGLFFLFRTRCKMYQAVVTLHVKQKWRQVIRADDKDAV